VIPFHHCTGFFDTTPEERAALPEMLFACKETLDAEFSPAGNNLVVNIGEAADQRVMHCHVHIIPRYPDPVDNLQGGIRGISWGSRSRGFEDNNRYRTGCLYDRGLSGIKTNKKKRSALSGRDTGNVPVQNR